MTYQMSTEPKVKKGVKKIIKLIKKLELDGETVEHILEVTGNIEQMQTQLCRTE